MGASLTDSITDSVTNSIYVVILNWNLPGETIACIRSLLEDGFASERILVVDNGSTDGSLERISAAFDPSPRFLRSEFNRGFAGGNNLGIRQALGNGAQWVWLLNNDTIVPQGTRTQLERAIRMHPEIALFSPLILYYDDPARVWSLGRKRIPGTLLTYEPLYSRSIPPDLPKVIKVDSLTACALLVNAKVFRRIGLLDEGYFMYGEDGDFCCRARRGGFRLACWTPARILHKVSLSSGSRSASGRRWRAESMARFYRLHGSALQSLIHFPFVLVRTALLSLIDLKSGNANAARATWQGWREGWFGRIAPATAPMPSTVDPLESP